MLMQTQLQVEQLLQMIDSNAIQFINRPIITESIRTQFTARDYKKVNELSEGLYKLQTYDTGIQNVSIVSFHERWLLDNSGLTIALSDEQMKPLTLLSGIPALSQWITDDSRSSVVLVKKLPINTLHNPEGILATSVPMYKLQKFIPEQSEDTETVIMDADYHLLTELSISTSVLERVVAELRAFTNNPEGISTIKTEQGALNVIYRKSPYNGWTYLSLITVEQATKETKAIGWYTLMVCSAVFVILLVFSLFGSRKMYLPIRSLLESVLEGREKDDSKQEDELQVIGDHIHSLRLSKSKLTEQIQGQTQQLKEFFVRKLLLDELTPKEIKEKQALFQYDTGSYCLLTVQIDSFAGTRFHENDRDLLMFAVNNIVLELIPSRERLDPVVLRGSQVTILRLEAGSPKTAKDLAYAWAEQIQSTVKAILELSISVGISRFHEHLAAAARAYAESLDALKYRIRFGEGTVLHVEDVLPEQRVHTMFPEWMEKQLIDAIMIPDLEKARQLLHEFLTTAVRDNLHYQEYQMMLFRLLADLIREIQNSGYSIAFFANHQDTELFSQVNGLRTVGETERWFMTTIIEPMVSLMSSKLDTRNKNISDQMKDIIHHDFESDITLEVCSSRLNYHPNYLKTVFRKETGINFSDYLSQYRLNQAKKWLLETDLKIAEIAERIRYQNPQNFIRYFRKMEDMTPGEYRKKFT